MGSFSPRERPVLTACTLAGLALWGFFHFLSLTAPVTGDPATAPEAELPIDPESIPGPVMLPEADFQAPARPLAEEAWMQRMRQVRPPDELLGQIPEPPGGWAPRPTNPAVVKVVDPSVLEDMRKAGELDPLLNSLYDQLRERTLKEGSEATGVSLEDLQKMRNEGLIITN
jgi:hypothetical protein